MEKETTVEDRVLNLAREKVGQDYQVYEKNLQAGLSLLRWVGEFGSDDGFDVGIGTEKEALDLLEQPDGSLSVILGMDAFHHSEDLDITLKECYRVLKKGGTLIAVDRAWPDRYTREELEAKLDVELNDNLKRKYNIPVGESFTRRDFGEHEYTLKEWHEFFSRNGFDCASLVERHPPILNRIFLRIPTFKFSIWFSALMYRMGSRRLWIYGFSKRRVLFVCVKR